VLHHLYSQLARARRRYYQRRPHLRRRLARPVVSIGNLTVGGSGKTPLAAEMARMLLDMGERPAILSRGYARRVASDGVVVVSDGTRVHADVDHAGDEPLMLAHMVPQAAVLVSASRYLAGRIAESRLGCTVHILDDGFQHFDLMRDVDLLVAPDELDTTRTLPTGRLREPLDAASAADALLVERGVRRAALAVQGPPDIPQDPPDEAVGARLGVTTVFTFSRRLIGPVADRTGFAFAGIARPERFYSDLEGAGWQLAGRRSFPDHHPFSLRDIESVARAAREAGAQVLLTTEKDAVRLAGESTDMPIVVMPMETSIEPRFRAWLGDRLRDIRSA